MENILDQTTTEDFNKEEEATMHITWEELENGEEKTNKFKEIATNKNVQIGAAATTISGIIGFLLGKAHEQKVQKKLLERVSGVILETRQALLTKIEEASGSAKVTLEAINEATEMETEYKDVKTTLEASSKLALDEIERLSNINKFNVIAHNRAKQWIKVNKELSGLVMLITAIQESQEAAIEELYRMTEENKENKGSKN